MEKNSIERIRLADKVTVSVVIPHFYPARDQNLKGLIEALRRQSFKESEIIIVHGVSPQGQAINEGARAAEGEVLMVMDDDSRIGHPQVIENLVRVIREHPSVAMAGASIVTPENANWFQKSAARQFPRFQMPIVKEVTDSDLPCHGCVAFRKEIFMKVGMERGEILRGLDPDLRVRIRRAGYRVVLAPETWVYHPLPPSLSQFIRVFLRNGYGSAYLQAFYPEMVYDTDENLQSKGFVPKHSFWFRLLRYPFRLAKSLVTFQWIRFLGYTVYVVGYLAGSLRFAFSSRPVAKQTIETISLSERIQVSVIIPHFYASREENLKGLIQDLRRQSLQEIEILVVIGVSPQGKAINQGVHASRGEILVIIDDDSRLGHSKVIENLVGTIRGNEKIGMAGASVVTPENANRFQKMAAKQFPRFQMPIVEGVTESDFPGHPCAAFPKEVFTAAGMEREDILRGLDPDLRVRIRKAGYRVVLTPQTWVYHPLPRSFFKFIQLFLRNGYGSAYLQRFHPEIIYDTDESLDSKGFIPQHPFFYRFFRYPFRLAKSLVTFQWIRFLGYTVYLLGYLMGTLRFVFSRGFRYNKRPL